MKVLAALMLVAGAAVAGAAEVRADQEERYDTLIHELRCLVCQNQSLAESNAPLAEDLREQVRGQMAAGRSNEEIIEYLTARYGDFVLYRPKVEPQTWLLWFGPFVLLAAAVGAVLLFVRRSKGEQEPVADPEAVRRELDREDGA